MFRFLFLCMSDSVHRYGLIGAGCSYKGWSFAYSSSSDSWDCSTLIVSLHKWIFHSCFTDIRETWRTSGRWDARLKVLCLYLLLIDLPCILFFYFFIKCNCYLFLQVTLALEPLTDGYDSSSSVPTTDISLDAQTDQNMPVVSSLDQPLQSNTGKEITGRSAGHIPRFIFLNFMLINYL